MFFGATGNNYGFIQSLSPHGPHTQPVVPTLGTLSILKPVVPKSSILSPELAIILNPDP